MNSINIAPTFGKECDSLNKEIREENVMSRDEREEMQLQVWVRLDEVKNLVSACKRGCDASMQTSNVEMRSIYVSIRQRL